MRGPGPALEMGNFPISRQGSNSIIWFNKSDFNSEISPSAFQIIEILWITICKACIFENIDAHQSSSKGLAKYSGQKIIARFYWRRHDGPGNIVKGLHSSAFNTHFSLWEAGINQQVPILKMRKLRHTDVKLPWSHSLMQITWSKAPILWRVEFVKICQNDWARLHQGRVIWRQANHPSSPETHQLTGETMSKQKIRSLRVKIKAKAVGTKRTCHWRLFKVGWFRNLQGGLKEQPVHVRERTIRKYSGTDQSWRHFWLFSHLTYLIYLQILLAFPPSPSKYMKWQSTWKDTQYYFIKEMQIKTEIYTPIRTADWED